MTPQRYRVVIVPHASAELVRIFEYIERDSPQNAQSVIAELFGAIDSLDGLPYRCEVHRSNKNPERIVRSMVVRPFIIYYRVIERDHVVEVQTVRHGARRQPRRFKWK
jgi:plasmid stabilization system protein ParE